MAGHQERCRELGQVRRGRLSDNYAKHQSEHRFIVQQNQGVTALQLWTAIKQLNRNITKTHRGLARQKWQSCKQSFKQSLDEYIAAYGKVHSDLLLLGVVYDREAELSQFLAGLDDRRHPTNGLVVLDF